MRYQPATTADKTNWFALRKKLWPDCTEATHQQEIQSMLNQPERFITFLVFTENNEAAGFLECSIREDLTTGCIFRHIGYLEGIFVAEKYLRHGVAKTLLELAEHWFREKGLDTVGSDTGLENTPSQAMHQALGFEETDRGVLYRKKMTP